MPDRDIIIVLGRLEAATNSNPTFSVPHPKPEPDAFDSQGPQNDLLSAFGREKVRDLRVAPSNSDGVPGPSLRLSASS